MQHVAAFKAQLELSQDAMRRRRGAQDLDTDSAAQPVHSHSTSAAATAQAEAEEQCFRAVVDLREAAIKLDKHKFEKNEKLLDCGDNKALFVPR